MGLAMGNVGFDGHSGSESCSAWRLRCGLTAVTWYVVRHYTYCSRSSKSDYLTWVLTETRKSATGVM